MSGKVVNFPKAPMPHMCRMKASSYPTPGDDSSLRTSTYSTEIGSAIINKENTMNSADSTPKHRVAACDRKSPPDLPANVEMDIAPTEAEENDFNTVLPLEAAMPGVASSLRTSTSSTEIGSDTTNKVPFANTVPSNAQCKELQDRDAIPIKENTKSSADSASTQKHGVAACESKSLPDLHANVKMDMAPTEAEENDVNTVLPSPFIAASPDVPMKRAFLSVEDEKGLDFIVPQLVRLGFSLFASPETARSIELLGYPVVVHEEYAKLSIAANMFDRLDLGSFEVLIMNLYDAKALKARNEVNELKVIPTLFLAYAAKEYYRPIVTSPDDYAGFIINVQSAPTGVWVGLLWKVFAIKAVVHALYNLLFSTDLHPSIMLDFSKPKRAFISVVNGKGMEKICNGLISQGFTLFASEETAAALKRRKIPVTVYEEYTKTTEFSLDMFKKMDLESFQVFVVNRCDVNFIRGQLKLEVKPLLLIAYVAMMLKKSLIVTNPKGYDDVLKTISRGEEIYDYDRRDQVLEALLHCYITYSSSLPF